MYTKTVTIETAKVKTTYRKLAVEDWNNIVKIAKLLAENKVGPAVLYARKGTLITERVKIVKKAGEVTDFFEKLETLIAKLHRLGVCHGDVLSNVGVKDDELVLIDLDTAFLVGHSTELHREIADEKYAFEDITTREAVENAFIQNDRDAVIDAREVYA